MKILDAYDLTGSLRDAGELAGCSHHTVKHYVERRAAAGELDKSAARPQLIDEYLPKVEEWVERSQGKVRADRAHEKLLALGYTGSERTTRRAVATVKKSYRAGHVRVHRPWITEPGMWLQYDYGDGPVVEGVKTVLFVAWLAWSRFRVVLPLRDKTMPSVFAALDVTFRRLGGVPTYVLTDNARTVSIDHVAGVAVRHPQIVAAGRHYGTQVHTCVPFDPESKGGTESTVRLAKADVVPTEANLRPAYGSFAELEEACEEFCAKVNGRVHRESARIPAEALLEERRRLHVLPAAPHTLALGETRTVNTDQTVRYGSVRYSTPPGLVGAEVWARVAGTELVLVADLDALPRRPGWAGERRGLVEVARHRLSTPGTPRIDLAHYPDHPQDPHGAPRPPRPQARSAAERDFLDLGPGAHDWLIAASAAGTTRIRAKMAAALELAALVGTPAVEAALAAAAQAGRFGEEDLTAIVAHQATAAATGDLVMADETHSAQPGTATWAGFTTSKETTR